jgi:hypothetical protein
MASAPSCWQVVSWSLFCERLERMGIHGSWPLDSLAQIGTGSALGDPVPLWIWALGFTA